MIEYDHRSGTTDMSGTMLPYAEMDVMQADQAGIGRSMSWLLVSDTKLIATPIPAALFMFAPALLGFFGFRRKMQA